MGHLFTVDGRTAPPISRTGLTAEGLLERQHLQEWVIAHPQALGESVLVITAEYDRWADTDGVPARDRLDVLGLDTTGRIVVAESRADGGPPTGSWQRWSGATPSPSASTSAPCDRCPHPWRVLTAAGKVSSGFRWPDRSRTDSPLSVLVGEGVYFDGGTADPDRRLREDQLRQLLDGREPYEALSPP
ncbi:hypothetical protein ACIODW_18070 [Streptomyces sp. NPDC087897]|uniref:hypothetical protein n=1 Tax=Streptomyces sp. NPDC087897 TaxID=3365817 RepID=UPI0037F16607